MSIAFDFDRRGDLVAPKGIAAKPVTPSPRAVSRPAPQPPSSAPPSPAPLPAPLAPPPRPSDLTLDRSRDDLLTAFGKATLNDRYLLEGESYQDMFARVSCAFADDVEHAQRLYDAMSRLWFMPATPVLSNGGTQTRAADLVLPQFGAGFAQRHCRHLERERLAGVERRRHRHLLGPRALDRREGAGRRDLRHHSLHPRDGRPHAGDQPGLAAPRLGRGLSRHPPSGDRGVPGDPQGVRRFQPQGTQSPSRHQRHRRVHARRAGTARCSRCAARRPTKSCAR